MKLVILNVVFLFPAVMPTESTIGQNIRVEPTIKKSEISIYPNPVQDIFQLSHPDLVKSISINNIAGREVRRFDVRGNNTFSIDDLSKGIYIVRLFDSKNEPIKVVRLNKA